MDRVIKRRPPGACFVLSVCLFTLLLLVMGSCILGRPTPKVSLAFGRIRQLPKIRTILERVLFRLTFL